MTSLTTIFFTVSVLAWIALEGWYLYRGQPTISSRVTLLYRRAPGVGVLAALVFGMLLGHFFF